MILDRIVEDKKQELTGVKAKTPLKELKAMLRDAEPARDFAGPLVNALKVSIIAEVKKASPSKGLIREDFHPVEIAKTYEQNGASAISVLTESKYFQGDLSYLRMISEAVKLPLLRKDFIFDPYQIYEARANGADAVLFIAAMLETKKMQDMYLLAKELGMEALAESHNVRELESALDSGCKLIGINNRDLSTFKVDIETTVRLISYIPYDRIIVSESGISTVEDIARLKEAGADAALIGEAIMRESDYAAKLRELAGV